MEEVFMLRSVESIERPEDRVAEESAGSFSNLFFNGRESSARYLVLNTGRKNSGRKVFISPVALQAEASVSDSRTDGESGRSRLFFYYSDEESY